MRSPLRSALGIGLLFCMGVAGVAAQTTAPATPPTAHFVITGNAAGFNNGSTMTPAVIGTAAMQLTSRISCGYEHIAISSNHSRWELGVVAYTVPLSSLLGRFAKSLTFDASNIGVTFSVGGGKLLQPTANRVAETAGIHLSYPLSDHVSLQLVGVDVLHGGVQTGTVTTSTTQAVSTGLNFYF